MSADVAQTRKRPKGVPDPVESPTVDSPGIDLSRYVPAYRPGISNKLSRGASQAYLGNYDVGIEVWRLLVLLAIHPAVSAQDAARLIGMDKASVSRCFKNMAQRDLIRIALDANDGRLRIAQITAKGRELHDRIRLLALERERALLEVLSDTERDTLIELLRRLHENLPAVEEATARYLARHDSGNVR